MKIFEFKVQCPQDNSLHDALIHVSDTNGIEKVLLAECHHSWQCPTCEQCLLEMCSKYKQNEINQGIMAKPL